MLRARYRRITFFFARILLSFALWDLVLPRLGLGAFARRTRPERLRRSAAAFRQLAVSLGGVMIKGGQFLSTRVDVLPLEITQELAGLQDEVPPVDFPAIRGVIEAEFGRPLEQIFASFEPQPLAAASLGQVHRAQLTVETDDGEGGGTEAQPALLPVVVKVQRPQVEDLIATDLAALRTVGGWLQRYPPIRRRADVPALLEEFSQILYQEIDYLAEGGNAETFQANFAGDPGVRVPVVYWTHTTKRVLTLENVWAIKINDYEGITAAGIDRAAVAARLLNTYLQQIFEDGFFHADPHPGNLFVHPLGEDAPVETEGWELTFVDFGMTGRVPPNVKAGLREMLIGVGTQDAARVVRSYQTLGILLPEADTGLITRATEEVFQRYWGKTMTELTSISPQEVRALVLEFRQLLYNLPFQLPHNLIFMGRAVGILAGICTGLDPQFNVWDHLAPFARKLIAEEARPAAENVLRELGDLARVLVAAPRRVDHVLEQIERGEVAVRAPEVTREVRQMERAIRQVAVGIIFAALLLGSVQLYLSSASPFWQVLLAGAVLSLVWVFVEGIRKG